MAVAVELVPHDFCGMVMGGVQSVLVLVFGMAGSMGLLTLIGYTVSAILINLIIR